MTEAELEQFSQLAMDYRSTAHYANIQSSDYAFKELIDFVNAMLAKREDKYDVRA